MYLPRGSPDGLNALPDFGSEQHDAAGNCWAGVGLYNRYAAALAIPHGWHGYAAGRVGRDHECHGTIG